MKAIAVNFIGGVIIFFLLLEAVIKGLADYLNLRSLRMEPPDEFRLIFDPQRYRMSQEYLRESTRFQWVMIWSNLAVLILFWFLGGFYYLDRWVLGWQWGPIGTGIVYVFLLVTLKTLLFLPFDAYGTFVIESRYGFNTTTVGTYLLDLVKGGLLALALGIPTLAVLLAFFEYAGPMAWLYCWMFSIVVILTLQYIFPAWIMPLFNRFDPLDDGELRRAIFNYAERVEFPLKQIFVMDGSRRSTKSNAFFSGFGRHRKIVLFDTLIERHPTQELVAILAHEVGHFKKRHVFWNIVIGVLHAGILFYLLSWVVSYPPLFQAFYVPHPSIYAGLIFFGLLYSPVEFLLGIGVLAMSRKFEFAADRFSVQTTRDADSMIDSLIKLAAHNLTNLTPHPLYTLLHGSHPPVLARVQAISGLRH